MILIGAMSIFFSPMCGEEHLKRGIQKTNKQTKKAFGGTAVYPIFPSLYGWSSAHPPHGVVSRIVHWRSCTITHVT